VDKLKLNEFKALYRYYRQHIKWFDHLLLAALVWLESKLIDIRVINTVDQAIETYKAQEEPPKDMVTPIYTETPPEGTAEHTLGFSEIRLTAPWVDNDLTDGKV
jgi:hypothetical protein